MVNSRSHPAAERSVDDIVGDAAGTHANLSEAPDTLADMTKSESHQPGELSRNDIADDMASDGAGARANLSWGPDTLAAMTNSTSHPRGERYVGDMVGDAAETRANLSDRPDTLAAMVNSTSHPAGGQSVDNMTGDAAKARFEPGGRQVLPEGLDEMAPGAALAAVLETVELSRLNGYDLVTALRAGQRQVSHYQSVVYEAMAETAHAASAATTERSARPNEHAADEIAAAVGYTRRKADNELNIALRLRDDLPEVASALKSGDIDGHKASVISDGTAALKSSAARGVAVKILASASGLTVGQIGTRLRRLCILEDPAHAQARYEKSLERRRVVARPTADGTTHLHILDCAPHLAQAAADRVNRIARSLNTRHESRSVDQLRADVALDLLTGRLINIGEGKPGSVNLHVDLTTLAGLDDHPGDLAGYGPVVSEVARQVAGEQQEERMERSGLRPRDRRASPHCVREEKAHHEAAEDDPSSSPCLCLPRMSYARGRLRPRPPHRPRPRRPHHRGEPRPALPSSSHGETSGRVALCEDGQGRRGVGQPSRAHLPDRGKPGRGRPHRGTAPALTPGEQGGRGDMNRHTRLLGPTNRARPTGPTNTGRPIGPDNRRRDAR